MKDLQMPKGFRHIPRQSCKTCYYYSGSRAFNRGISHCWACVHSDSAKIDIWKNEMVASDYVCDEWREKESE